MKQTLEEAAIQGAEGYNIVGQVIYKSGFKAGAKWEKEQSPWISIKDGLPEVDTIVLTKGAYGYLICFLSTLGEWETGANVNEGRLAITHWMPIPPLESNDNE